jgi:hypothetical protein
MWWNRLTGLANTQLEVADIGKAMHMSNPGLDVSALRRLAPILLALPPRSGSSRYYIIEPVSMTKRRRVLGIQYTMIRVLEDLG